MRVSLGKVQTDFDGFSKMIVLYHQAQACKEKTYEIDMSTVSWFDANMCALLGAALFEYGETHGIRLLGIKKTLHNLLQRNGFLSNFGFTGEKVPDFKGTTIEYQRFEKNDSVAFKNYVERHFVGKGIPDMTPALLKKFRESIAELFENAVEHSNSIKGIFACGQFFPNANRLDFSVADLGIGIRNKVNNEKGLHFDAIQAIKWAMAGQNTTRRRSDKKPGGLGLKLIKEFIELNRGKIQIISDTGYWSYTYKGVVAKFFSLPYPGTVVNIEINTADKDSYCLASELVPADIF